MRRLGANWLDVWEEYKHHVLNGLRFGMRFSQSLPFWGSTLESCRRPTWFAVRNYGVLYRVLPERDGSEAMMSVPPHSLATLKSQK